MKKLIVLGIIATMVMGMAVAASAAIDDTWAVTMKAFNGNGQSGSQCVANTKVGASDAYTIVASEDGTGPVQAGNLALIYSSIIPDLCVKDTRAPFVVGEVKVWNYITRLADNSQGPIRIDMWVASIIDPSTGGDPDLLVQVFKGEDLLWTAPLGVQTTSKTPMYTYNGMAGDSLTLVASTIVPEPGSMVALFSGLVGLVGFGIRRRK